MTAEPAARTRILVGPGQLLHLESLGLLRLFARVHRPLTVGLVICWLASGLLVPASLVSAGWLTSSVQGGQSPWWPLAAIGALFTVQRLLGPAQQLAANALGRRVDEALNQRTMRAMAMPPGVAHLEDPAVLDAVIQAQGGVAGVTPGGAAVRFGWVWPQRLQAAVSLVIIFSWRWWAALGLTVAYLLAHAISRWHWHQVTEVVYGRTDQLRRAYYLRKLALSPTIAKETRVFGLASWLVDHYRGGWLAVMGDIWRKRDEGWLLALVVYLLVAAIELGVLVALVSAALAGVLPLGQLVTLVTSIGAAGVLAAFNDGHYHLSEAMRSLRQVEALERAAGHVDGVSGGQDSAEGLPRTAIRFEGVTFRYPGRAEAVFDGLDLEIPAGRSLAIVGDNGAGKTTLMKLLCRLHDPQGGRITVDGRDLRQLAPASWHGRLAAIFQDFVQFELSARDNVAFGALPRRDDQAAIQRAAEQAGAAAIVARFPGGWSTPLSRQFSGGAQPSGGEWQRLALARALFAVQAGAGVLILDEPTASLDVRGEAELYDRFLELTRGSTTLVISHRFSTVRRADHIVVLDGGRVVEEGTHDQLVRAGGRYAAMYRLQAARFDDSSTGERPAHV